MYLTKPSITVFATRNVSIIILYYHMQIPTRRVCVNVVGDLKQLKKVLTLNNNVKNWASRKDIKNYRFEILIRRIVICT